MQVHFILICQAQTAATNEETSLGPHKFVKSLVPFEVADTRDCYYLKKVSNRSSFNMWGGVGGLGYILDFRAS